MWAGIAAIVVTATAGDVLQARAMKEIGDLGVIRRSHGWVQVVRRGRLQLSLHAGTVCSWHWRSSSLLITLSWGDVSVVGPASASLTFIVNAFAAADVPERARGSSPLAGGGVRGWRRRFAGAVKQQLAIGTWHLAFSIWLLATSLSESTSESLFEIR